MTALRLFQCCQQDSARNVPNSSHGRLLGRSSLCSSLISHNLPRHHGHPYCHPVLPSNVATVYDMLRGLIRFIAHFTECIWHDSNSTSLPGILIQNKVLTADNLARRGWPHQASCALCHGQQEIWLHMSLPYAHSLMTSGGGYWIGKLSVYLQTSRQPMSYPLPTGERSRQRHVEAFSTG